MATPLLADGRAEGFGAAVTIADLAIHSFPEHAAAAVHTYAVWRALERDGRDELDRAGSDLEFWLGVSAKFRDGSVLHIAAWAARAGA